MQTSRGGKAEPITADVRQESLERQAEPGDRPKLDLQEQRAKDLLRVACHDLRAPLVAIQTHLCSVWRKIGRGEEEPSAWLIDVLGRIDRIATEGSRIVEDVLSIQRLDRRKALQHDPVDIEEVIAATIQIHAEGLRRARCEVFVERDEALDHARGCWDQRALKSLFSNLLQNVTRYASGAPVRIRLAGASEGIRIRVTDGGPGMPASPSADATRGETVDGSHGLGIWIIHLAIAELGGEIEMRNDPGGGLTSEIWLPR